MHHSMVVTKRMVLSLTGIWGLDATRNALCSLERANVYGGSAAKLAWSVKARHIQICLTTDVIAVVALCLAAVPTNAWRR